MKKIAVLLIMGLAPILLEAQNSYVNYNPFVEEAIITPSPLLPSENGGKGELSFSVGNTGTDPLKVDSNQQMLLTITLSHGAPDLGDPLLAISGSFAMYFSWSYNSGTYSAVQVNEIPSESSGTIIISFDVTKNSLSPGSNGFNVNITPSPYQTTSNNQDDDAVSSYTYTDKSTILSEMEASPFSIFPNPSKGEILIELVGENGSCFLEIFTSNGSIVKQEVLHMEGSPVSVQLNSFKAGLYHVRLKVGEKTFQENLIIVE